MLVVLYTAIMSVDLFCCNYVVDCCNYAVTSFAAFMQVKVSPANMWVTIFTEIMHMGNSVVIMQVVFSAVQYAHDYLSLLYLYAGDCFCCSYVCNVTVSSSNFIFLSLTNTHFS